jgi:hypothetical protein
VAGVTPVAAAEVGGDPTVAVEVAHMTCQLMECRLGGTLVAPLVLSSEGYHKALFLIFSSSTNTAW